MKLLQNFVKEGFNISLLFSKLKLVQDLYINTVPALLVGLNTDRFQLPLIGATPEECEFYQDQEDQDQDKEDKDREERRIGMYDSSYESYGALNKFI